MLLSIRTDVCTLAIGFDGCSKRIVRISFCFLQDLHFGRTGRLVSVEHDVHTIGKKIIRVDRHAFQIMVTIDKDTNLRIMTLAKVKIGHTTANFHDTIFVQTTFIAIPDGNTA